MKRAALGRPDELLIFCQKKIASSRSFSSAAPKWSKMMENPDYIAEHNAEFLRNCFSEILLYAETGNLLTQIPDLRGITHVIRQLGACTKAATQTIYEVHTLNRGGKL
jgi:hypothetical protein